ncbi:MULTISPECIES: hypothetical protein [unclassified Streptomyces]|uniref:hypothetical protein n=1 Tax=unclassified Streptomyces TaxID=2593676 RepID=UPI0036EDFD46
MRRQSGNPRRTDQGQTGVEYLGLLTLVTLLIGAIVTASISTKLNDGFETALCRLVQVAGGGGSCDSDNVANEGQDAPDPQDSGSPEPGPDEPVTDPQPAPSPGPTGDRNTDDPFQPAKCLLASDDTKDTVVIQILFIKISHSEQVKLSQWSDGSVTLERMSTSGGGVTGSIGASIPGLKKWGGGASLSGSYVHSSGSGGQWMFNAHKSDDSNADLRANLEEAKQFSDYLKEAEKCRNKSGPRASELGMICSYWADKDKPDVDPERAPDIDITKTTTEKSGSVSFGGKYAKNDKEVAALRKTIADEVTKNNPSAKGEALDKIIKDAQANSIIKDVSETKSVGNVSAEGVSGALSNDVVVMRHKTGPDSGKITFVYTFSLNGSVGPGGQAKGSRMQQVAVTYDAEAYDREEKAGEPHHPKNMKITTSQESGGNDGVSVGGGANAGPVTIDVGGGGGKTESDLHTEVADVNLTDEKDSTTVEDWLRGRGSNPADESMPSPSSMAEPLPADASDIRRLLHDKGKLQRLDYRVNTDWWNASLGIGFGFSAGQFSIGFKLFGIDITHEHRRETLTGDPTYASAPGADGTRPWKDFTNCTRTQPITS